MTNRDNLSKDNSPLSEASDSQQRKSYRPSSEQAGQTLRWLAEDIINKQAGLSQKGLKALSSEEMRHILHELRVHQIELEMQNEELRRTQLELQASQARFVDLFDFAPVGFLNVSKTGLIIEINLTGATQLRISRATLLGQPFTKFILPEDQDIYYLHCKGLLETKAQQTFKLRLLRMNSQPFWVLLTITKSNDEHGELIYRLVVTDITDLKRAEEDLHTI